MKTLIIAPHPDDEIIGVGGTLIRKNQEGCETTVCIVTKGYEPLHNPVVVKSGRNEDCEVHKMIKTSSLIFLDLPANELDTMNQYIINNELKKVIDSVEPDEVFIPFHGDIHIDHKIIAKSAMVAVRPKAMSVKRIFSYEVPSETGWDFNIPCNAFLPNVFVDISKYIEIKKKALQIFKSQIPDDNSARSIGSILSLNRLRGSTIGLEYAESFILEREII